MNLASVVNSPFLNTARFTITRDPGSSVTGGGYFGPGGWVPETKAEAQADTMPMRGIVVPAEPQLIMLLPEGDRIGSVISIFTSVPLRISAEGPPATLADIVTWQGQQYRVTRLFPWSGYGYYHTLATQLTTS